MINSVVIFSHNFNVQRYTTRWADKSDVSDGIIILQGGLAHPEGEGEELRHLGGHQSRAAAPQCSIESFEVVWASS